MIDDKPGRASGSKPFASYKRRSGASLAYDVEAGAVIVAEKDFFYTLYKVGVVASDGMRYRHLLIIPTNISAVSFEVGLALLEKESIEADAGNFDQIERLASAVQTNYRDYRTFPPPTELNRFCM